ncbi:MAG: lysophospholipase [Methylococcaceae bacterium]|jgi:alpha-beta hydrolase superfamily lysophospholipase
MIDFPFKLITSLLCLYLSACTPGIYEPGAAIGNGQILDNRFITADGTQLPLKHWIPQNSPVKAVLIAIHGFNDYSNFLQKPGHFFSQQGIACYAYDQRGFGGSPKRGLWSGTQAYIDDLNLFVRLSRQKYQGLPIYLLGESMGGAIVIATLSNELNTPVDGAILVAPAVWARQTMPWYQQSLLWTLAHTLPWLTVTGKGIKVMPSDNIEMLKALSKDPWVIKSTRIETIYGLTDLMDDALNKATKIEAKTLMLYGEKDDIIPKDATSQFVTEFLKTYPERKTIAFYEKGYHMLLRDLGAATTWQDIVSWINTMSAPLPSGADLHAKQVLVENGNY